MDIEKPPYWDEWVIGFAGSLQLREGAPPDVIKAFEEFMQLLQEIDISHLE